MNPRKFKTKKGVWTAVSILAFGVCWLYPMHFGKEGTYPLGRLWPEFVRGNWNYWFPMAFYSVVFGILAVLIGFAVQALVAIVQARSAQPRRFTEWRSGHVSGQFGSAGRAAIGELSVGMHSQSTHTKRLLAVGASAAGLAILAFIIAVSLAGRSKAPLGAGGQLVLALQRFSAAHRPLPATVTFSQLISEGYLGTNVLREFGASEVTVYLNADDARPQSFLMDAVMPDGTHTTLLSDGSVQGFARSRFQQAAAPNGGLVTPPGGSDGLEGGRHR